MQKKAPLSLSQSNIGVLRVFELTGIVNNWIKENDCFINEPEVLNKPQFVCPLADSKDMGIVGAGATN
jgi:hypothetical protein